MRTIPWEQIPRGPEGRPLNVSPARKGWVGIPITILSARGAAALLKQLTRSEFADEDAIGGQKVVAG